MGRSLSCPDAHARTADDNVNRMGAIGVLLLMMSFALATAPPAEGAPSPCQNMPNVSGGDGAWFAGVFGNHGGQVLKRVKGYIENYNPYMVESSSAWVMLHNESYEGRAYAQAGWLRTNDWSFTSVHLFAELKDTTTEAFRRWDLGPAPSPQSGDVYELYEVRTDRVGNWAFDINGVKRLGVDDDDNWAPNQNQTSAEVHNQPANDSSPPYPEQGDQIAGDPGERVGFHEVKVYINGGWVYEDFYVDNQYQILYPNRSWFGIWRDAYLVNGKIHEFDTFDERCPN